MTPEQIYDLAQLPSREAAQADVAVPQDIAESKAQGAGAVGEPVTAFKSVVERVTEALAAELKLPSYEEWAAAYRVDPHRFDDELLGLWRDNL